ncbi:MAG TPA: hypothetical protein VFK05_06150 [Polyangiaceae bacterium]|nr:hypothetical protein [Polyangiaceae bacterium]
MSAVADYCTYEEGEVLQRVEEKVFQEIGVKVGNLEAQVESNRASLGAEFLRTNRRIAAGIATLKQWKATAGVGVGKIKKTREMFVPGIGTYHETDDGSPNPRSPRPVSEVLDEIQDPAAFLADFVNGIRGELVDVATLKGVEKVHHALVQRLVTLLHVEELRASGAWLQIMLAVAEQAQALANGMQADLGAIYDVATFAHAEPGFVGEYKRNGARHMNAAAKQIFHELGGGDEYEVLASKQVMTAKQREAIVDLIAARCVAKLEDLASWLGGQK